MTSHEIIRKVEDVPTVSVIMNCLNCEKYLREAIESVYAQTYLDWEIIFLDNCSTDGSAKIAQEYDAKLRYFLTEETWLLGKARNIAIENARGKFIAFLDCDDSWNPDKLSRQLPLFENPKVGLVFSGAIIYQQSSGIQKYYWGGLKRRPPTGDIFSYLLKKYPIVLSTAVLRMSALNSMEEWFDNRLQVSEEFELFIRIAYDWHCDYVDMPLTMYRVHLSSITFTFNDLFAEELAYILEKMSSSIPGFTEKYSRQISSINRHIRLMLGRSCYRDGEIQKARKLFAKNFLSPRSMIGLFATYIISFDRLKRIRNSLANLFKYRDY